MSLLRTQMQMFKVNIPSYARCLHQTESRISSNEMKKNKGYRLRKEIRSLAKANDQMAHRETKDNSQIPSAFLKKEEHENRRELSEGKRLVPLTLISQIRKQTNTGNNLPKAVPPFIVSPSKSFAPGLLPLPFPFQQFAPYPYPAPMLFPRMNFFGTENGGVYINK